VGHLLNGVTEPVLLRAFDSWTTQQKWTEMNWRHRAACRTNDPELFFPLGTSGPALDQLAEAKSVCHRCPVVSECLAWALVTGQDFGVWGGMSEHERRELRQRERLTHAKSYLVVAPADTDASIRVRHRGSERHHW
jgi:WhiB family transcriptional regulator, redox-sensing transcriptional regulator